MGKKTTRQVARLLWERVMAERKNGMRSLQSSVEDLGEDAILLTLETIRNNHNLTDEQIALEMKKLLEVEMGLDKL